VALTSEEVAQFLRRGGSVQRTLCSRQPEYPGLPNSFGDCYYFNLPNTRLLASVSHKLFIRPSGNENDNDLTPDIIISQTDEDWEHYIDTVLEFAKRLN